MSQKRDRSRKPTVQFGADGLVVGWHFAVGEHFRAALDVQWTVRIENRVPVWGWTEGLPPLYAFAAGDVVRSRGPGDVSTTAQVVAATPDDMVGNVMEPGKLTMRLWSGDPRSTIGATVETTQRAFVRMLRTGVHDAPEPPSWPITVMIDYVDAGRRRSRRAVTILSVRERAGELALAGRCHLRDEERRFLVERIAELVTPDGEVIGAGRVEGWIRGILTA